MEQLLDPGTLIFLIPIVAIIGAFVVKLRKMELEREHSADVGFEEYSAMKDEILSLRQRMENVEAIIAGDEPGMKSESTSSESKEAENYTHSEGGHLKNMLH